MAHQTVMCSHCATAHSEIRCDACEAVIERNGPHIMMQSVQLGGPLWQLQSGGDGKTYMTLCEACARGGVDLVDLASTRIKYYPDRTV